MEGLLNKPPPLEVCSRSSFGIYSIGVITLKASIRYFRVYKGSWIQMSVEI